MKKWALILGGSSGLGLATAKKLGKEGFNLLILHRDPRNMQPEITQGFEEIAAYKHQLFTKNINVLDAAKIPELLLELTEFMKGGQISLLVHSISRGNLKPMFSSNAPTLNLDDLALTAHAMAFSLYEWVRQLIKAKLFSKEASVVSFTSEGSNRAWSHYAAVSVAKASLEALTRSIAKEFAPIGLRCNCLQAGVTDTRSLRMIPGSEELKKLALARNPLGRLTLPEDVANVVYLLTLPDARWINGAIIPVDGGESIC